MAQHFGLSHRRSWCETSRISVTELEGGDAVPLLRGTSAERVFAVSQALTSAAERQILLPHYR